MREIQYKSHIPTLGELALSSRGSAGDYQAILEFIICRTDLTEAEAKALDIDDIGVVMEGIGKGFAVATHLLEIGKSFKP